MAKVLVGVIRIYQRFLSPILATLFGASCLYVPTCSHYAVGAIRKHGALRGTGYALWRILRCNPFSQGGFDPVP